ncbi:hypothetical protein R6Y39_005283, partial [Escherichia coli]|nr:hypothetical protein [Escherichia coli]ELT0322806.1 hypothetical protein [Escherichia coli]
MKNIAAIKRNNRKIHARKFLSTPEGKAWLERKQRENEERKLLSELKWLKRISENLQNATGRILTLFSLL